MPSKSAANNKDKKQSQPPASKPSVDAKSAGKSANAKPPKLQTPSKEGKKKTGDKVASPCFATSANMIPPEPSAVPLPRFDDDFDDGEDEI